MQGPQSTQITLAVCTGSLWDRGSWTATSDACFLSKSELSALSRLHAFPRNGRAPSLHGQPITALAPACLPLPHARVLPTSPSSQGRVVRDLGEGFCQQDFFHTNTCAAPPPLMCPQISRLSSGTSGSPALVWPCLQAAQSGCVFYCPLSLALLLMFPHPFVGRFK